MPPEITNTIGSPTTIVLANAGDFDNLPFDDTDQIDLTSLANGAARESDKFDFGENWAEIYDVMCSFEVDVAPVSGEVIQIYIAPSIEVGAGDSNPGGIVGVDGVYTGTAGDSLEDSLKQLDYIGSVICTADADPVMQTQSFQYAPRERWGTVVVVNESGQAFVADGIHHFIILSPITFEIA